MSAISGIIAFMLIALFIGKRSRRMTLLGYITISVLAMAQVALVFYFMLTMEYPSP